MGKLTAVQVKNITEDGSYTDGEGLRLKVSKSGTKSWLFRYRAHGKAREMGLGTFPTRSLKEARDEVTKLRKQVLDGIDPLAEKSKRRREAQDALTFEQCMVEFHAMKHVEWSSAQHVRNWMQSMRKHCFPVMKDLPVAEVETEHVLRVIKPLWTKQPVLAANLRERIESVLSWATSLGYREGLNPALWRGHLEHALPKKTKFHKVKHHPALPYQEIGSFLIELREMKNIAARGLEFTILTAARTKEARGATWEEIDLEAKVWSIPAERMKMRNDHRVPLSMQAIALLESLPRRDGYIFPSARYGWQKPMAAVQMGRQLKKIHPKKTVHGFRSSFRQWCAEQTNYPREVAELSLAHSVGDSTEQAYQRSDLLEKRRPLMQAWADHCDRVQTTADVVGIRSAK